MMKKQYLYAAAALSLAVISGLAVAKRASEVEFVYYDAKYNIVGGKTLHCGGGISQWGKVTGKSEQFISPCN